MFLKNCCFQSISINCCHLFKLYLDLILHYFTDYKEKITKNFLRWGIFFRPIQQQMLTLYSNANEEENTEKSTQQLHLNDWWERGIWSFSKQVKQKETQKAPQIGSQRRKIAIDWFLRFQFFSQVLECFILTFLLNASLSHKA